jgi:hypothetical protein
MLSSWQVVGYLTALVVARSPPTRWLVTEDRMSKDSALLGCRADVHQCAHSPGTDGTATRTSSAHQLCRQANQSNSRIVSVLVIWSIFACTILLKPAVLDYYRIDIGTSVTPSTDFDVVIAAYDRPGIEMAHDIDSIMSLQTLQNRTTSIYIYNKGPETAQFERNIRQNLRNASTLYIEGLDNKGKEGGTYLHHIVSQWDSLARHTLFIQEQPHDFALLKQRIADYLVPETGFMSLSYEGKTWKQCEHLRAGTWTGITESISRVSSMVNSSDTCQDPLLTFRGQFLVSDARIRSNSKTMYTQSRPNGAPYLVHALRGTFTLHAHCFATTHFLYSRRIEISSPKHYAQAEYSHASLDEHVGRAIAYQSGRLPYTAEHGTREMRSYTLRTLRMCLK